MLRLFFTTILLTWLHTSAIGQLFYDSFSYSSNSKATDYSWTEHSGSGFNPISTVEGLSFGNQNIPSSGLALSGSGQDIHRIFEPIHSGVVYTRLLVNVKSASEGGDYFFHLGPNPLGTDFKARVFAKAEGGKLKFGVSKSSSTAIWSTKVYDYNATYLLIVKYTFKSTSDNDDLVELVVLEENADLTNEEYEVQSADEEQDADEIGAIALRQGSSSRAPSIVVDELKVSTTWSESINFTREKFAKLTMPSEFYAFNEFCISQPAFSVGISAFDQNFPLQVWSLNSDMVTFSKDKINWLNQLSFTGNSAELNDVFWVRFKGKIENEEESFKMIVDDRDANQLLDKEINFQKIALRSDCTIPISEFKSINDGTIVKVRGIITASANEFGNFNYVQDNTGGLRINGIFDLNIGDSVRFQGIKSTFQDEVVIELDTCCNRNELLEVLGPSNIKALKIPLSDLPKHAGELVEIDDLSLKDQDFVFLPNTNETVQSESTIGTLRIWGATELVGLSKPQSPSTVTGIVGQYRDQFQLYPRVRADIPAANPYVFPSSIYSEEQTFDFAAWNVEWFGSSGNGPNDDELQLRNVTKTISDLNPDAIVLTEVSNLDYFNRMVDELGHYKGSCSNAVSGGISDGNSQRVCLIYNANIVELIDQKPLLAGVGNIPGYPESSDRFWASGRFPALFVCDVNLNGIPRRLHLIGIHARANRANGEDKDIIYNMRKTDIEVLKDTLDTHYSLASIIIAGDFNDDLDESVVSGYNESTYSSFVNDNSNWNMVSKTLSEKGYKSYIGFDNVIDHIGFSNELNDSYLINSVSLALPFVEIDNYTSTTSDHLPVMARFLLNEAITSNELSHVDSVLVYPNPSKGQLWISTSASIINNAELFTANGQLLISVNGDINKVEKKISKVLSKSANGMFLLKLLIGNNLKTYKIVSQH